MARRKSPEQLEREIKQLVASLDAEAAKGDKMNWSLLVQGYRTLKGLAGSERAAKLVKSRTLQAVGRQPRAALAPRSQRSARDQRRNLRHHNRINSSNRQW
jgi:hypothetical protein